jgi:hypothetical protein
MNKLKIWFKNDVGTYRRIVWKRSNFFAIFGGFGILDFNGWILGKNRNIRVGLMDFDFRNWFGKDIKFHYGYWKTLINFENDFISKNCPEVEGSWEEKLEENRNWKKSSITQDRVDGFRFQKLI